jgi:SAM-dependent methyltransferase
MDISIQTGVETLHADDFAQAFGEPLSDFVKARIARYAFSYTGFSDAEQQQLLIKIVDTLMSPDLQTAGSHRLGEWEAGWGENLQTFRNDPSNADAISPRYFDKYNAIRWRGRFIRPVSAKFEGCSLAIIVDWLLDKYARDAACIYEFGCGTGHNLLQARDVNAKAALWGLDWASSSQQLIEAMREGGIDPNIYGKHFDYFAPDTDFSLAPNSVVLTVASLEQVGDQWGAFVDYLRAQKPALCIHIEPIAELLDPDVLIDNLSIKYFKKRRYLDGFLAGLRQLEAAGEISIHKAQRTHIGSLFIEGYSVVVWSPRWPRP